MDPKGAELLAHTRVVVEPERLVWVSLPPSEAGAVQRRADRFHAPFCLSFAPHEVSVVCREVEWGHAGRGLRVRALQGGYRMITLEVELRMDVVGYLRVVTDRLAREGVPVSVVSTFHRDHLLVREEDVNRARAALESLVADCRAGIGESAAGLERPEAEDARDA